MVSTVARTWVNALVSVLATLMLSAVIAAPVAQTSIDGIKQALKTQLKDQEQALESLATLTNKAGTNGLEVSKLKSLSYSNVNGAENKLQQQEEKVSDPETAKVLSDIAETVEQKQDTPDAEPKTSFKASVDIPQEGIHKQISTDGESSDIDSEAPTEPKDTMAFTPEIVAEYLKVGGKMDEFQDLMSELVDNAEISPEEAEQYEKSVMDAYYDESQKPEIDVEMPMMDTLYPQGYADESQPMFPYYNAMPFQDKNEMYPLGYDETPLVPASQMQEDDVMMDDYPVSLDDMINYLLNEWLTRAIVTGDPEAGEILSNIVEYVSRDNNPNDEEQVKAILGDIIAETLLEDLMPRTAPQPMPDFDAFRNAAKQNVPVFPFPAQQQQQQQQQQQTEQIDNTDDITTDDSSDSAAEQADEITQPETELSSQQKDDLEAQLKM